MNDSPADVRIMQEALENGRVANRLRTAADGAEAMTFLRREGPFKDAPYEAGHRARGEVMPPHA